MSETLPKGHVILGGTCNQLAKTVVREAREKALNADFANFAELKSNNELRLAYKSLKETLRNLNISWFDRDRSDRPSNQTFSEHYAKLFTRKTPSKPFNVSTSSEPEAGRKCDGDGPTLYDVESAIAKAKVGKAPGKSGITLDFLKAFSDVLVGPMVDLYQ